MPKRRMYSAELKREAVALANQLSHVSDTPGLNPPLTWFLIDETAHNQHYSNAKFSLSICMTERVGANAHDLWLLARGRSRSK